MSDLAVRGRQPVVTPKTVEEIKAELGPEVTVSGDLGIDPPFTSYKTEKHKPFTVDYFKLDGNWEDKTGGFKPEIELLEGYITSKVEQGQLDNTLDAVRAFYKKMEKMCQADRTDRVTMRIAKMAAYAKFLKETDNIKLNYYKHV